MGRLIEAAVVLGIIGGIVGVAIYTARNGLKALTSGLRRHRREEALWCPKTRALEGGGWVVSIEREGEPPHVIETVERGEHYRLFEFEAEAESLAQERNSSLKRQRRLAR